jgi:hypothetical protein
MNEMKTMEIVRPRAPRAGALLAALALAGVAGASSTAGEARVQLRAERPLEKPDTVRVSLTGGVPWGAALLCVEGCSGRVLQAVQLDGQGSYVRDVQGFESDQDLRLCFRASSGTDGPPFLSNIVEVPPRPAAGPPTVVQGAVVVTEIMKDPKAVSDAAGEWLEVFNSGGAPVNLEGWSISDQGSNNHVIAVGGLGLVLGPGARLVLGINDDPTLNGGVVVDYEYKSFTLANSADQVLLKDPAGTLMESVAYDGGTLWPSTPGAALSLSATAHSATLNDDPANWCDAVTPVSAGSSDFGSPGTVNPVCP